ERRFYAPRQVVQGALRRRAQQRVEAHREDAFLATLQRVAQTLRILEGDLTLWIGETSTADVDEPRRLELDQLVAQQFDDGGCLEGLDMEADFNRMLELQERSQPAGRHRAGIADDLQNARVLVFQAEMVAGDFHRGWRQQVRQRARSQREATFLHGQRLNGGR